MINVSTNEVHPNHTRWHCDVSIHIKYCYNFIVFVPRPDIMLGNYNWTTFMLKYILFDVSSHPKEADLPTLSYDVEINNPTLDAAEQVNYDHPCGVPSATVR